ncbi:winged helix DNA-binding domain-containing protein [Allokutzneria sp. A3M-2-11 16]|uniref:winged helix DNA-binding domain-containing protein n=1 Tax=Allokutzneria sp. A3M-2-11 16 TaxID=2962043 RepID=UPI0020B81CEA|nr:winged helix DNA-binding domain-containing protein [Allokutzneria sp. A3M-2-11 16]MCP3805122.1 winged helix DNA-binding domain-containing protein [Allokutzneria sp. A3M-2-11 16]
MTPVLGRRALNRATLERQMLLRRTQISVTAAVEHLVGMQAQTPHTWYLGLWSRLAGFQPSDASALLESGSLVRIVLMRGTIHLVTPIDAAALRPLVQPVLDRDLATNTLHSKPLAGLDFSSLAAVGESLLASSAMTAKQLGSALSPHFPSCPPASLAYAIRNLLPLIQVPPRGLWGRSGPIAHRVLTASGTLSLPSLVLRYLGAFGPASVLDVQKWCGLTRLSSVMDELRPQLMVFRDSSGRELFDLPSSCRPDPETPAPVRFLYDFDNVLLSHADRSRVLTEDFYRQERPRRNFAPQVVLVDGFSAAEWSLSEGVLSVRPYRGLDWDSVAAEGLLMPGVESVVFEGSAGFSA